MPIRTTIPIELPPAMPERCIDCPLLGTIPKDQRRYRSQKIFVCLGSHVALSQRFISSRVSNHDAKHPMHKPCEDKWLLWLSAPQREFHLKKEYYTVYRLPFEQRKQMVIDFDWDKKNRYGKD